MLCFTAPRPGGARHCARATHNPLSTAHSTAGEPGHVLASVVHPDSVAAAIAACKLSASAPPTVAAPGGGLAARTGRGDGDAWRGDAARGGGLASRGARTACARATSAESGRRLSIRDEASRYLPVGRSKGRGVQQG